MNYRTLGSTDLRVSEISFGAWQLGNNSDWGGMDDSAAHDLVAAAINQGINLFDTAPNYAGSRSEALLGEALAGQRQQLILVSKFGHRPDGSQDYSVDALWKSLEESLIRLKTDFLDVLLIHNPPATTYAADEAIWPALEKAKQQGKIRHYGASLDFADEIEACLNNTGSEVLEILFNIMHQDVRRAFPLVKEKHAGLIAKVPLDSGWLTGRFNAQNTFKGVRKRWSADDINQRAKLVASLSGITSQDRSQTHTALAFLLAYQEVSCVIPGVRNQQQLLDNLGAVNCTIKRSEQRALEQFWDELTDDGSNLLPW